MPRNPIREKGLLPPTCRPSSSTASGRSAFPNGIVERGEAVAAAVSAATSEPAYGVADGLLITAEGGCHFVAGAPEYPVETAGRGRVPLWRARRGAND